MKNRRKEKRIPAQVSGYYSVDNDESDPRKITLIDFNACGIGMLISSEVTLQKNSILHITIQCGTKKINIDTELQWIKPFDKNNIFAFATGGKIKKINYEDRSFLEEYVLDQFEKVKKTAWKLQRFSVMKIT